MLDIEFAQASDPGRTRDHNEDYLGYFVPSSPAPLQTQGWLFALADGVGGQDRGEVASRTAVESLIAGFSRAPDGESYFNLLPRLVKAANTKVFETGMATGPGGSSMATTVVTCAFRYDRVVVCHVGDSRCYLIRHRHAEALTRDHTVTNEQVRLGLLTSREASESETLGNAMFVNVDTRDQQVLPGDVLLLCSDGLHGAVTAGEMADVVAAHNNLEQAVHQLVDVANQKDGSDNISVQLIRIRSVERVGMYRGRPYKLA
jgi:serine/threonine protein phosphatase PrpC